jgi:hypothetical protein
MKKLFSELERLYFLPGQQGRALEIDGGGSLVYSAECVLATETLSSSFVGEACIALSLISPDGMVRVISLDFNRAADWGVAANLYQALQDELDLPAPAVSVSGQKGYRLWLSLAEPIPVALANDFVNELSRKYLAEIPVTALGLHPNNRNASVEPDAIMLAPARHPATGKWSAFVDPGLVGMFIDEQWLEMAPNMDRQAEMLAGLKCTEARAFQRALAMLQQQAFAKGGAIVPSLEECGESANPTAHDVDLASSRLNLGSNFSDPVSFLLAVMNDSSANATQRIEAAKALLPYFAKVTGV